jgi:pimeloyl-ACP methyl ester carboxylesterase/DNA-binding CsgD family transcriptional regulator
MTIQRNIRFCKSCDGVELAMGLYGRGPPLLKVATWLTHVELEQASPFDRPLIETFAPDFRYVSYDARGCGLSQRHVDDVSFEAWVRDLEAVADALALDNFSLLGISQGAAVAVAYAAKHPERVSRLILLGGFATSYFTTGKPDPAVVQEAQTLLKIVEIGWGSAQPAFRQVFVSKFLPDATAEQWREFDALQKATVAPEMAVRYLQTMYSVNVKHLAAQVRCPVLSLHMKGDQLIYFDQGRRLAASIPGARFVPLEGNNHIPLRHEPAWTVFVSEVLGFLGAKRDETPDAGRRPLTPRQRDVLGRVARGQTDKEIARDLRLSPRTVEMHVGGAMKALGAKTRAEAVAKSNEHGHAQR